MQKQTRIVIENVKPQLNSGTVFIKRVVNEVVHVTADVLVDGHDVLQADLLFKHENDKNWQTLRMQHINNDEYTASFSKISCRFRPLHRNTPTPLRATLVLSRH